MRSWPFLRGLIDPPIVLLDVGAADGLPERWRQISNLEVIAFEPDGRSDVPAGVRLIEAAVGAPGPATMHLTRKPQVSSLLAPDEHIVGRYPQADRFDVVATEPVVVQRVDALVDERIDAVKVDTQGTELAVLESCGRLLESAWAVEVEVEFVPLYRGQPLFGDVDAFLRSLGFMLVHLRPYRWRRSGVPAMAGGEWVFADACYIRDPATMSVSTAEDVVRGAALAMLFDAPAVAHHILTTHADTMGRDAQDPLADLVGVFGSSSWWRRGRRGLARWIQP